MQPPKKLSIPDEHTAAGVTQVYELKPSHDGIKIASDTAPAVADERVYDRAERATSPAAAELQFQDTFVSPDSRVPSSSGSVSRAGTPGQPSKTAHQAAEGGTSVIKSATLASLCEISNGMKIAGRTTHSAAGQQVYDHAKRAVSPAGSASQGSPNTLKNGNEAAGAQNVAEHATRLDALLSGLPNLEIAGQCPPPLDEDSENGDALSDAEHSTKPASLTTPPNEYGGIDGGYDFVAGDGMEMMLWPAQEVSS